MTSCASKLPSCAYSIEKVNLGCYLLSIEDLKALEIAKLDDNKITYFEFIDRIE